ncbi:hypothetical protein RIVM261_013170 [Rivularia sp. IAM M-261]|nr:hypothetical protein RIVM261_013170 [Rivularia sp. IAM M-261]
MSLPGAYDAVLGGVSPRPYDAVLGGKLNKMETQAVKQATNSLSKYLSRQGKFINITKKVTKEASRVMDALKQAKFDKISKPLGSKMAGVLGAANLALGIAGVGLGLANLKLTEIVSESQQSQLDMYGREIGKQLQLAIKNTLTIRRLERRVNANDAAIDVFAGTLGQQTIYVNRLINEFQLKQEGQKLITENQGKLILDLSRTVLGDTVPAVSQLKTEVKNLQTQVRVLGGNRQPNQPNQAQVNQLNARVSKVEAEVKQNDKEIAQLKKIPNLPANILQQVRNAVSTASNALGKVGKLERELPGTITKLVDGKITEVVQASNKALKDELGIEITKKLDKDNLVTEIKQRNGDIIRVLEPAIKETTKQIIDQKVKPLEVVSENVRAAVGNILEMVGGQGKTINDHTRRLDKEGIDNDKQAIDIEILKQKNRELDKKIREQEKVNQEGNKKLDDLLKWSLGIPPLLALIPRRTADLINPNIPTRPQIGQIVRDNTPQSSCRFSEVPINNAANRVNAHSTALDVVQTGLITNVNNTANTINTKLGEQLTGGIAGKLVNGFKWLQLDRALSVLTFAATVQNHLMLSREIGTTLLGAFSNVLSLIGLKDDSGQAFDLGSIINSSIENLIKGIVGAENYAALSETWAKANRIYQATTNVLNSFQSLTSTILTGMELIGSYTGKIGNALKKSGEVLETAYGWMNPQPKFNRVTQTLENLQQGASTIQQVTQAPLDVINAVTELQNANTELIKAIKEDDKPENKAAEIPEPDKLKADELASKIASRISNILPDDLFNAAD